VRECVQLENLELAREIAALPDRIRGYENIKLESIRQVKALAEEKLKSGRLSQVRMMSHLPG